jgi:hypothetical protein
MDTYPPYPLPLVREGGELKKKGAKPPSLKHFPLSDRNEIERQAGEGDIGGEANT